MEFSVSNVLDRARLLPSALRTIGAVTVSAFKRPTLGEARIAEWEASKLQDAETFRGIDEIARRAHISLLPPLEGASSDMEICRRHHPSNFPGDDLPPTA